MISMIYTNVMNISVVKHIKCIIHSWLCRDMSAVAQDNLVFVVGAWGMNRECGVQTPLTYVSHCALHVLRIFVPLQVLSGHSIIAFYSSPFKPVTSKCHML